MSEWISVEDGLPPPDEENDPGYSVFVLITDGDEIGIGSYEYEYFATDPEEPLQYASPSWHDAAHHVSNPSHWMHLPELPK